MTIEDKGYTGRHVDWKFVLQTWFDGIKLAGSGNAAGLLAVSALFATKPPMPGIAVASILLFGAGILLFVCSVYCYTIVVSGTFHKDHSPEWLRDSTAQDVEKHNEPLQFFVAMSALAFLAGGACAIAAMTWR